MKCEFCKITYEKNSKLSFHRFPKGKKGQLWLTNMKAFNWRPRKHSVLCSSHFEDECFIGHYERKVLREGSVPTIFTGYFTADRNRKKKKIYTARIKLSLSSDEDSEGKKKKRYTARRKVSLSLSTDEDSEELESLQVTKPAKVYKKINQTTCTAVIPENSNPNNAAVPGPAARGSAAEHRENPAGWGERGCKKKKRYTARRKVSLSLSTDEDSEELESLQVTKPAKVYKKIDQTTRTAVIPENSNPNNATVEVEPDYEIKVNDTTNTNAQKLSYNVKPEEKLADIQIKIEPLNVKDIQTHNDCITEATPKKLQVEFETKVTNDLNDSRIGHEPDPNNDSVQSPNIIIKEESIETNEIQTEFECELEIECKMEFEWDSNTQNTISQDNNINSDELWKTKLQIECKKEIECESDTCDIFSQDNGDINGDKIRKTELKMDKPYEKLPLTEEVFIKNEYSSENYIKPSPYTNETIDKYTNATPAPVANIKEESIECESGTAEFTSDMTTPTSELIECKSEIVECRSDMTTPASKFIECRSDIVNINTDPDVDKAMNDVSKPRKWYICNLAKHKQEQTPTQISNTEPSTSQSVSCKLCNIEFCSEHELQKHNKFEHKLTQSKPFRCSKCLARFKYEFMLIAHMKGHSGKVFKCDICSRQCKTKRSLAKHLNSHTRERLYSCPTCEHNFTERSNLLNHLLKHTPNETYSCISCNINFTNALELKKHSSVHKNLFPCKSCEGKFSCEADLDDHMKSHIKFLECTFCNKQFKDGGQLQRHTLTHKDMLEKVQGSSHSCQHCGKRFLYLSTMLAHEKSHSLEKPFTCAECPRRFKTSGARNEHVKGHRLLFKCDECGKSFARQNTLERHQRLHTGEKPYACHLCDRSFAQRVALNYHLKTFHGDVKNKRMKSSKGNPKETGQVTDVLNSSNNS